MAMTAADDSSMSDRSHWQRVYETRQPDQVSWYQPSPARSLQLVRDLDLALDARIIDVGGGASFLVWLFLDEIPPEGFWWGGIAIGFGIVLVSLRGGSSRAKGATTTRRARPAGSEPH